MSEVQEHYKDKMSKRLHSWFLVKEHYKDKMNERSIYVCMYVCMYVCISKCMHLVAEAFMDLLCMYVYLVYVYVYA